MKANYYKLIELAVDQGIGFGLNRAFKHTDEPTREQIHAEIEREIMTAICEYLTFDETQD
jgi:hypothetical protein